MSGVNRVGFPISNLYTNKNLKPMFTGTYFVEIDKKHRLIIPSRLRSELWKLKEKSLEVYLTFLSVKVSFLFFFFL